MAQRRPRSNQKPSLEVIVGNENALANRSDGLLHDVDKKPNLSGHNSPRRGLGKQIADSVRDEVMNWVEGQRLRTSTDLAQEFPGGNNRAIRQILAHHFRDEPHILELRREIISLQGVQHLQDRPLSLWSQHSQKGYDSFLGKLSKEEKRSIGYRALNASNNKKHLQGVPFASAQEFALGQVLKLYVPKFSIKPGDTFQVPIGTKTIDYYVPSGELGVFVEWHPIKLGDPRRQISDFPDVKSYKAFQKMKRRSNEGRGAFISLWKKKLLEDYATQRRELIDSSSYDGTPLVVGYTPVSMLDIFPLLDLTTPNPANFVRSFKELTQEYKRFGIRELNRRYSL